MEKAYSKDFLFFGKVNDITIKWKLLDTKNNYALFLCDGIIARQQYNHLRNSITWEHSTIREWLNSTFLMNCFTDEERVLMRTSELINENNPFNGTSGGNNTNDVFFLLSISEVNYYMPRYFNRSIGPRWWLRTPGDSNDKSMYIGSDGQRQYFGYNVDAELGIRPAVWINTESSL